MENMVKSFFKVTTSLNNEIICHIFQELKDNCHLDYINPTIILFALTSDYWSKKAHQYYPKLMQVH